MKEFILDTHSHTVASGHAYGTVLEMARAASERGLQLLAITDHAPALEGSCSEIHFRNFKVIDQYLYGVEILMGAELNIMDYEGNVDLGPEVLKKLPLCIASLHTICLKPGTKKENTRTLLKVMENPYVHIIGHPDDGWYEIDYEAMVREAKAQHVLIEINNSSLVPGGSRIHCEENMRTILRYCEQYGQEIVVNTDSHFPTSVGRFDEARALLEAVSFPEELIVNTDVEKLKKYRNRTGL